MNRNHPKSNRAVACLLAATLFAMGCRSTSSGVNNPFLAPDRVAPPSTRVLAPGQAQPYYQGDPLPAMQSANGAATKGPLAVDSASARSASGKTLAWNAPASGAPAGSPTTAASAAPQPWGVNPQASVPAVPTNETAISIPTDTDAARFALPTPTVQQPPAALAAAPISGPQQTAPVPSTSGQSVALASYNAPVSGTLTPVGTPPALSPTPQVPSQWRSPQSAGLTSSIPGYAPASSVVSPTISQPYTLPSTPGYMTAQTPPVIPTNPMAVELRSVPSPSQPGDPIPRIRIPGYDVPETAAADGFRPRTSMR